MLVDTKTMNYTRLAAMGFGTESIEAVRKWLEGHPRTKQTPLTLEEVKAYMDESDEQQDVIGCSAYAEDRIDGCVHAVVLDEDVDGIVATWSCCGGGFREKDYDEYWRVWLHLPTKEERGQAPWKAR